MMVAPQVGCRHPVPCLYVVRHGVWTNPVRLALLASACKPRCWPAARDSRPGPARRDPSRPIVFSIGTAPSVPLPREIVLDCSSIPRHGPW